MCPQYPDRRLSLSGHCYTPSNFDSCVRGQRLIMFIVKNQGSAMNLKLCVFSTIALLTACSSLFENTGGSDAGASSELFEVAKETDLNAFSSRKDVYPVLMDMMQDPATEHVQRVNVNALLIDKSTHTLSVPLGQDKQVMFRLRRSDSPAPGMLGWVGDRVSEQAKKMSSEIDFDPLTWISLVREGDKVTGAIYVDGESYRLQYVGAGQHVLVKVDEAKLPAEDSSGLEELELNAIAGKAPLSEHSTISVLFFSTNERRVKNPDYRMTLGRVLQEANQVMINSQVPVTFKTAGFIEPDYAEGSKTGVEQFMDFRTKGRAFNSEVVRWRDAMRADIVTLYTSYPGTGGEAAGGGYTIVGKAEALAHEYGHVLGATHGWSGSASGYNYGYSHENPKFHTRMVTTWGSIPYFSNPKLTYQGFPIGTPEHHDVARRINERREVVEGWYPPVPPYLFNQGHQENGKPTCMVVGQSRYLAARACPESAEPDPEFIWKPVYIRNNLTISLNGSNECLAEPVGGGGFRLTGCPDPRLVVGSWLVWTPRAQTDGSFLLEWGKTPRGVCLAVDASNDRIIDAPCDDTNPLQRWRWSEI